MSFLARSRGLVVVTTALAAVGAAALPAQAASVVIRSGDLIGSPLDDTRATGHKEFLRNGLHLWTEGSTSTDKVTAYFPIDATFPTSADMDYVASYGDTLRPGIQLVFDVDGTTGNGNDYNILVGEATYANGTVLYGNQWWLTNGSSPAAKAAAPHVGGGYGSQYYGTLSEWAAAFSDERALAGGVSLGSGVKGDGILKSLRFGSSVYEFTKDAVAQNGATGATGATGPAGAAAPAPKVVDAEGSFSFVRVTRGVKLTLMTDPGAAGEVVGKKVRWIVKVDGEKVADLTQGLGDKDRLAARFAEGSGKHEVVIKKDGDVVRTLKVRA